MSLKSSLFAAISLFLAFPCISQTIAGSGFGLASFTANNTEPPIPLLRQPENLPDEGGLLFSWEVPSIWQSEGIATTYQLSFYDLQKGEHLSHALDRKPFFSKTLSVSSFHYEQGLGLFAPGAPYIAILDTRLIYPEKTVLLDGKPNAIQFSLIPECTVPSKILASNIGTNNFTVDWSGIPAKHMGYKYQVRYRIIGSEKEKWQETMVTEGNSLRIDELLPGSMYEVEVRRICPSILDIPEMYSDWSVTKQVSLPAEKSIVLPNFVCGDPFNLPPPCVEKQMEQNLNTLQIGGFPIEVITNTPTGSNWTGTGYVPLPFGFNNKVKVEWTNVYIDMNGTICNGTVYGISDDPLNYPNLNPGPVAFGGEICIPPPSSPGFDSSGIHNVTGLPWDENGFGPTGSYSQQPPYPPYFNNGGGGAGPNGEIVVDTSGQYDPWGFDANGNHIDTGTNQNENGCTQEQMNSLLENPPAFQPEPCGQLPFPYAWLNPGAGSPPTSEGAELADEVTDSLEYWLIQVLDELQSFYQDSIDLQALSCDGIRSIMNGYMGTLGYEREYIFGPDDEYFAVGMHKLFNKKPQPMALNTDRDETQKELEKEHIKLYDCDRRLAEFQGYLDIIDSLKTVGLSGLAQDLLYQISHFSAEDAEYYSVHENLMEWLRQQCKVNIDDAYQENYGFGYSPILPSHDYYSSGLAQYRKNNNAAQSNAPNSLGNYLAYGVADGQIPDAFLQSFSVTPEDISFQYLQGWKDINGVPRAYYLDAMAEQRISGSMAPLYSITENDETLMPIIVSNRASDGRRYNIYLDSIIFTPSSAVMNAYCVMELPNNGQKLVFEAHALTFTPTGFPNGPVSLNLGNDVNIRLSNAARIKVMGNAQTYVSFNCGGFAGLGIEAEIEICRGYVKPIDGAGNEMPDPERVNGKISAFVPSWGELYVEISMDPFVVTGVEDIKWHIDQVVVDFSETISPSIPAGAPAGSNLLPPGYSSPFTSSNGFGPEWQGFYIRNFSATLPNHFSQSGQSITVGVEKVIIDDTGFSGEIFASPVLSLADGNAGGWAFSVEEFQLAIAHNALVNASFNGLINVPIFKSAGACGTNGATIEAADCFNYTAFIEPGNIYNFTIKTDGDYCVDMWKAGQVVIDACSSIKMEYANGDFSAIAELHGSISIGTNIGNGMSVNAPNITFENVEVSNKAPYFSPGTWGFPSVGVDFGGFEINVQDLAMVQTAEGDPALSFGAELVLSEAINLAASGRFKIVGELANAGGRQSWKFKEMKVDGICLDGKSFPGVDELSGCIHFYENAGAYGSGFRGQVDVSFTNFGSVKAVAQFGSVSGDKYFFVDALFCSDAGIPMGPVKVYGLGGGVSHHMNRPTGGAGLGSLCGPNASIPTAIGSSISGITYLPDMDKGLGIKMTLVFGVAKKEAFNANATFEVLFNSESGGGGLSDAWVYGNAKFMDELTLQGAPNFSPGSAPNSAQVSANVDLHMDFNSKTFSGKLETFLNVGEVLRGAGSGNRMADAEVLFAPGNWYIKVGSPSARAGLIASIPGIGEVAQFGAYLQIGMGVDPPPPLPPAIAALTGLGSGNFQGAIGGNGLGSQRQGDSADGFIFGADLQIGAQNKNFGIFRATLSAQLGFDVSVLDYGGITCANNGGAPLGINGWYANGQVYAGLDVELGIKVKVFGQQKQFSIFDMSAAVAMQAGLPNPFWAKGGVGASYNLLNGLIKGQCNFQVSLGEQCEASGGGTEFEEVPIIGSTTPIDNETGVSVRKKPYINFNFPVEKSFAISDFNGNNFEYFIHLDYAKIKMGSWEVPVMHHFNGPNDGLEVEPKIYLPRNTDYTLEIKVHVDSSGVNVHEEMKTIHFTTGGFLNTILAANVAGSYPLNGQYNFYKGEIANGQGYIQLKKGQPDLFYPDDDNQMLVRIRKSSGECSTYPMNYNALDYKVTFPLEDGIFTANGIYQMELVNIPTNSNGYAIDPCAPLPAANPGNASGTTTSQSPTQLPGSPGSPGSGSGSSNPPQSSPPSETVLYKAYFRVSQYNTFLEKMTAWAASDSPIGAMTFKPASGFEPFDKFEVGSASSPGLVEIRALTNQTPWFSNTTQINAMYSLSDCNDYFCVDYRDVSELGWPANKAVYLTQTTGPSITGANYSSGSAGATTGFSPNVWYAVANQALGDQNNIRQQIAYYWLEIAGDLNTAMQGTLGWNSNSTACNFYAAQGGNTTLFSYMPKNILDCWCNSNIPLPSGNFPVVFRYRLPGTGQVSSVKEVILKP